jgi:dihydroneopterin aldolase
MKTMKISIDNLEFKTIIGILDFERKQKQLVSISISFLYKFSDDYFIDYAKVVDIVKKTIKKNRFYLIEDAILKLKKILNKKYKISDLKISICKPDILDDCLVSISI